MNMKKILVMQLVIITTKIIMQRRMRKKEEKSARDLCVCESQEGGGPVLLSSRNAVSMCIFNGTSAFEPEVCAWVAKRLGVEQARELTCMM